MVTSTKPIHDIVFWHFWAYDPEIESFKYESDMDYFNYSTRNFKWLNKEKTEFRL